MKVPPFEQNRQHLKSGRLKFSLLRAKCLFRPGRERREEIFVVYLVVDEPKLNFYAWLAQ